MNPQIVAMFFQEGGRLLSELIRNRSPKRTAVIEEPSAIEPIEPLEMAEEREATATEGTACVPCINSHFSTCSGLLSDEAIRMARRHGIGDEEIHRINSCIDQMNAMEREDMAIDKIVALPKWEKDIAVYAQSEGAKVRHALESAISVEDLERVAVHIKETRTKIGKDYFKGRLANMKPEEKKEIAEKAMEKLEEEG